MMSSCCGSRKKRRTGEEEPLLAQYPDDTPLQRNLHAKLHTYQQLRALSLGYLPSNEQTIANLRTVLALPLLQDRNPDLSDSGRILVHQLRRLITEIIDLLRNKNGGDQLQEFLWCLGRARVSLDVDDVTARLESARPRADMEAAYSSIRTVGSLLLQNTNFRLFLSDVTTVGREVLKDAAIKTSEVSRQLADRIEPTEEERIELQNGGSKKDAPPAPTVDELQSEVVEASAETAKAAASVVQEAGQSAADRLANDEGSALASRLKQTVASLRQRPDYNKSVSILSNFARQYADMALEGTAEVAHDDVQVNKAAKMSVTHLGRLVSSFGSGDDWKAAADELSAIIAAGQDNENLVQTLSDIGGLVQDMLTDPAFFDDPEVGYERFRDSVSRLVSSQEGLRDHIDRFLEKGKAALESVVYDQDIAKIQSTLSRIFTTVSPAGSYVRGDLTRDAINVFVPLAVQAIQYIPIPRLEVSTPDVDMLLENLILEPGQTVNQSSFLPYQLRMHQQLAVDVTKTHTNQIASTTTTIVTVTLNGMSVRADDVGYWLRSKSGFFSFVDSGLASFRLDERGIDVEVQVEIGSGLDLERILTLRSVRCKVHKLDYELRRSAFSVIAWIMQPLLRPVLKKVIETQVAQAIADGMHAANREIVFARERLRATRIANPDELSTFVRAVLARLTPQPDPELDVRVGVDAPGKGVFKGVYAPGSMARLWNEEATEARERVYDMEGRRWRNAIFDVPT